MHIKILYFNIKNLYFNIILPKKYKGILLLLVTASCYSDKVLSEDKDDTSGPTVQIEHPNRGEGESFSSF